MDPVAVQIGSLHIRWYGIFISAAIAMAVFIAFRESQRQGIDPDHILNITIVAVPIAIIGARLYFVIFSGHLSFYFNNPLEILAIWHGGLAIHGGLIAGIAVGYFYVRKYKLGFWNMADIMAPAIALGQGIGRWGNFFNQEAHGGVVSVDFIARFPEFIQQGMLIKGQYYHPTFLYESLWNLVVFSILMYLQRRKATKSGDVFLSYLVLYSAGRFFIEGLRTDSLMLGSFRMAQLVSLLAIVLAISLLAKKHFIVESKPGKK